MIPIGSLNGTPVLVILIIDLSGFGKEVEYLKLYLKGLSVVEITSPV